MLYESWLRVIREKEDEKLEQGDILECIRMMNSVILDTYKHWG